MSSGSVISTIFRPGTTPMASEVASDTRRASDRSNRKVVNSINFPSALGTPYDKATRPS